MVQLLSEIKENGLVGHVAELTHVFDPFLTIGARAFDLIFL